MTDEVTRDICNERTAHLLSRIDDKYENLEKSICSMSKYFKTEMKADLHDLRETMERHIENNQENYALIMRMDKDMYGNGTKGLKVKVEAQEKAWIKATAIASTISALFGLMVSIIL